MAGLFGNPKKTSKEEVVLIVDVENASAAAALVALAPGMPPKLFAEHRVVLPLPKSLDASALAREIECAIDESVAAVGVVAARLRNAPSPDKKLKARLGRMGAPSRAVFFLAPPWAALNHKDSHLVWSHEPRITTTLRNATERAFGSLSTTIHAASEATLHTVDALFEQPDLFLLSSINGELAELLLAREGRVHSRATIPVGSHTLLRTLQSHGDLATHEARSALMLARQHEQWTHPLNGPLNVALTHFGTQWAEALHSITEGELIGGILIVSPEPAGELFARALSHTLGDPTIYQGVFTDGGTVRALHAHNLAPYVAAHAANPDLPLMAEAVFISL